MLLLVLILVLIAFSLLVVALLSGSVLWAWVSVGVSVAAAAVLLIDYLQRRSAVKAGAQAGAVSAPPMTGSADVEPVTEVLPVIPRSGAPAAGDEAVNGDQQDSTAVFDQRADSAQTVVMPVVQPSASTDRPSGASHGTTSSGGDSSPTVTTGGPSRSPSGPRSGEAADAPAAPDGGAGSATEAASVSPASEKPAAGAGAGADATVAVDGNGTTPEASAPAQEPAAKEVGATSATGATSTAGAAGEAAGEPEGAAADADPPEEPHDPAAAAVVAGLDNEVLVIDEQPRYHVPGCRALGGRALIPLPAREAVELGFTPCGWCSPERTLAAQHAAAR
ncbi:hypothetical protein GCM10009609_55600 [Pseudonocardia aurantiaca]|uniref:Uncharacterized protein n=1 Tax=Pseudonocardia aurantiaca TaxID=75290 RepID=A0ABW4FGW0_9PSEU